MRGKPLDHSCGRVAKLALERRRVQQRCPRGFSGAALEHRPQNRAKGADPRTGNPQRRKVFLPGCSVFSLSWPACAGAFLVPGRWFSGPAPSGSCLFLFRLMFLSTGRGRHVPAPSGRDVGSSAGAPTQEPAFFEVSLFTLYVLTFSLRCSRWSCTDLFSSTRTYVSLTTATALAMSFRLVLIKFVFLESHFHASLFIPHRAPVAFFCDERKSQFRTV